MSTDPSRGEPLTTPIQDIDLDRRVLVLEGGEEVQIVEAHEVEPEHWIVLAGPTILGRWITSEFRYEQEH